MKDINYHGWTISQWSSGEWGLWRPDGSNTGQQFETLAKAKAYVRYILA